MPNISVVMVTYNHQKYIAEAINSVLSQTLQDFELIIVNDGSSDKTEEIIKQFTDPRISYIHQQNQGPCVALNVGTLAAKSPYIALMSGDDVCEHNRLARQYEHITQYPEYRAIFSEVSFINENSEEFASDTTEAIFKTAVSQEQADVLRELYFHGNFLSAPTCLIETKLLFEIGLHNVSTIQLQDFAAWIEVAKLTPIAILPEKLLRYRVRDNQQNLSSSVNEIRVQNEFVLIMKDFFHNISMDLFKQIFAEQLKNPLFMTQAEYELEQAFIFIADGRPRIQFIGYEKLFTLLQDQTILEIAKNQYQFDLIKFYALANTDFVPVSEKVIEKIIETIQPKFIVTNYHKILKPWNTFRYWFLRPIKHVMLFAMGRKGG